MITAVVGVGALGSLFAARLSTVTSVVLVGRWRAHLDIIARRGLQLIERDGRITIATISVETEVKRLADQPISRVLLLVKAPQTAAKADLIARFLKTDRSVLTLQNGLGHFELLSKALPDRTIFTGTTAQGATVIEPGVIRHAGDGTTHLPAEAVDWLDLLGTAGLPVAAAEQIDSILWGKLVINAGINPLSAIVDRPNGFLAEDPTTRSLMIAAAREAAAVAAGLNIDLPYDDPAAAVLSVALQTADNLSSMVQDVRRGAPTEIDAITGEVIRRGREIGVATPVNQHLYDRLHNLTDGARH